jgi:hypothetical protein
MKKTVLTAAATMTAVLFCSCGAWPTYLYSEIMGGFTSAWQTVTGDKPQENEGQQEGQSGPQGSTQGGQAGTGAAQTGNQAGTQVSPLRWAINEEKDRWGEGTGVYSMSYDWGITMEYRDIWDTLRITLSNFKFTTRDGVYFSHRRFEVFGTTGVYFDVRKGNGDERRFTGRILPQAPHAVEVPYSEDLAEFLSAPGARVICQNTTMWIQFDIPPRFGDALAILRQRQGY